MDKVSRFLDPVFTAVKWVTVILLTVMVAVETYEISMRTFTGNTPAWAKEVTLLSMVWMGCLGAAVLHRERGHITLEFVVDRYLLGVKRWILLGVDFLIFIFSAFIFYGGVILVREFMGQARPGTDLPVGVSYLPLAVTGALLMLTSAEHIIREIRSEEAGDAA